MTGSTPRSLKATFVATVALVALTRCGGEQPPLTDGVQRRLEALAASPDGGATTAPAVVTEGLEDPEADPADQRRCYIAEIRATHRADGSCDLHLSATISKQKPECLNDVRYPSPNVTTQETLALGILPKTTGCRLVSGVTKDQQDVSLTCKPCPKQVEVEVVGDGHSLFTFKVPQVKTVQPPPSALAPATSAPAE